MLDLTLPGQFFFSQASGFRMQRLSDSGCIVSATVKLLLFYPVLRLLICHGKLPDEGLVVESNRSTGNCCLVK